MRLTRRDKFLLEHPSGGETRCLGHGCNKTFLSPDRFAIRFCPKCRRRVENAFSANVARTYFSGGPDLGGDD